MIRITVEIDGVELATTTLVGATKPSASARQLKTALSEYLVGGATNAGAAPRDLVTAPELDAALEADSSDAGFSVAVETMTEEGE